MELLAISALIGLTAAVTAANLPVKHAHKCPLCQTEFSHRGVCHDLKQKTCTDCRQYLERVTRDALLSARARRQPAADIRWMEREVETAHKDYPIG